MPRTEEHTQAAVTTRASSTGVDGNQMRSIWAWALTCSCTHCCFCCPLCCLQHGNYTYKASGMQAVRQFVPPNTLRCAAAVSSAPSPQVRQLSCAQQDLSLPLHCLRGVGGSPCNCRKQLQRPCELTSAHAHARLKPVPSPPAAAGLCTTVVLCAASQQWAHLCGRA